MGGTIIHKRAAAITEYSAPYPAPPKPPTEDEVAAQQRSAAYLKEKWAARRDRPPPAIKPKPKLKKPVKAKKVKSIDTLIEAMSRPLPKSPRLPRCEPACKIDPVAG